MGFSLGFEHDVGSTFLQLDAEGALIVLGDQRPLQLIALVEEGNAEGKGDVAEDLRILSPGDDGTRAHNRRQIAVHEGRTRQIGDAHHLGDGVTALVGAEGLHLRQHDIDFVVVRQIVQRRHDRPAVHLRLVDLLRAVIEARRVAETNGVGGCEQAESRVRANDAALVEQRQAARGFQHALDDEHHVRTAGIVFVEDERDVVLVGPGQDAILKFGDLQPVLDDDGVLADEIDTADVAVEVDAHARPVEARGNLLDVRGLAGAVIARDHHATVVSEAGENGERGLAVEEVIRIQIGHIGTALAVGGNADIGINAENFTNRNGGVGNLGNIKVDLAHHVSRAGGFHPAISISAIFVRIAAAFLPASVRSEQRRYFSGTKAKSRRDCMIACEHP
ncbi:hypothetical protein RHSP_60941 [Rhizobium freirei PRF 81]|uniref:Uncharacterized protein n=1 Tax=Rhizobium freirei PRF 81 TaxID=363754 RepID=N6V8J9_9HYPH|nr:hypothetical protein RHSP_60941 [Rhizobium freirei PRF 81]